jgi:hypothetical protein
LNSETIFVIPDPDNPMPWNLTPHSVDLSNSTNPNITIPGGYTQILPEQIDGFDYLITSDLCTGCCENFDITVNSGIQPSSTFQGFLINANLKAGPEKIIKVSAAIIDFSISYNYVPYEGAFLCNPCVNNSDLWGNFRTPVSQIPGLGNGILTKPVGTVTQTSREMVWGNLDSQGIDMSQNFTTLQLNLSLPPKHISACCADTLKICVKYTFTDINCITCDEVVCYNIVRPATSTGMIEDQLKSIPKLEFNYPNLKPWEIEKLDKNDRYLEYATYY